MDWSSTDCLTAFSTIACFDNYPWKGESPKPTPMRASLRTKYSQKSAEDTRVNSEGSIKVLLHFLTAKIVKNLFVGVCLRMLTRVNFSNLNK